MAARIAGRTLLFPLSTMLDKTSPDVIDLLLSYIPNLRSLCSTIVVSKSVYNVYKTRPRSITKAVAFNEIGTTLPDATRLCHLQLRSLRELSSQDDSELTSNKKTEEEDIGPANWSQAKILSENATVIHQLEVFFSQRCKDRAFRGSKLSEVESHRLCRAFYRFWIFQVKFLDKWNEIADDIEDYESDEVRDLLEDQKAFLFQLLPSSADKNEFAVVYRFISVTVVEWLKVALYGGFEGLSPVAVVALTPPEIVSCIIDRSRDKLDEIQEEPLVNFFQDHGGDFVSNALAQVDGDLDPNTLGLKPILVENPNDQDQCDQCGQVHGHNLWNESNWDLLYGALSPNDILMHCIPGLLPRNIVDKDRLREHFNAQTFLLPVFLDALFEGAHARGEGLSKDKWLCMDCVKTFITRHICFWWVNTKQQAGESIPDESCWYGWNCRTQTHSMHHAGRLNHYCKPTR
ncbi:hypothetical protein OF83DRAFT_1094673 [Amylostereum chailletii]|nr:hypothetical protein OF83DRAFT_1094673 [Amylostereum chailletii]